jgi:hypothetical protein
VEVRRWTAGPEHPVPAAERPGAARLYDDLLGGSNNFAADRALARTPLAGVPDAAVRWARPWPS